MTASPEQQQVPRDSRLSVLSVRGVDFVRSGTRILSGIKLEVNRGEHWAILGPNGAGKSTLMSILGARQHPTNGHVEVLGHRLGRVDMRQLRASIGHVDPRHRLDQPLQALEVVLTGLTNSALLPPRFHISDQQVERARLLLCDLGMGERLSLRWTAMSQGERVRTLIARALMPEPELLLLDEPTTGLDIAGREQLLSAMDAAAQRRHISSVTVTHHVEELALSVSHVLLLAKGAVVAAGPIETQLTSENLSAAFDSPLLVCRHEGRWSVRAH